MPRFFTDEEREERFNKIIEGADVLWKAAKQHGPLTVLTAYSAAIVIATIILDAYKGDEERQEEMLGYIEKYIREQMAHNRELEKHKQ